MAYIGYGQNTPGGSEVAKSMFDLLQAINRIKNNSGWIAEVGPANLEGHPDFMVTPDAAPENAGDNGQAFNDTYLTISAALQAFLTDNANANANRIASLYRGG